MIERIENHMVVGGADPEAFYGHGEREESRPRECEAYHCTNEAHPESADGYCAKHELEDRIEALRDDWSKLSKLDAVVEWRKIANV